LGVSETGGLTMTPGLTMNNRKLSLMNHGIRVD
jgi:hypothetical protein